MGRPVVSHANLAMLAVATVAFVVVSLLSAIPSAAAATPRTGGWSTVKNAASDQHVADLASFAVDAYNKKQGTRVRFISVESAKSKVVAGTKWSITLRAVAPPKNSLGSRIRVMPVLGTYVTEVFESPTPVVAQPTVVAQPAAGDSQPVVANDQPVADGQASGVAQPALADYLQLVSFAKKK